MSTLTTSRSRGSRSPFRESRLPRSRRSFVRGFNIRENDLQPGHRAGRRLRPGHLTKRRWLHGVGHRKVVARADGLATDKFVRRMFAAQRKLREAWRSIGLRPGDAADELEFVSLVTIAYYRICTKGLAYMTQDVSRLAKLVVLTRCLVAAHIFRGRLSRSLNRRREDEYDWR